MTILATYVHYAWYVYNITIIQDNLISVSIISISCLNFIIINSIFYSTFKYNKIQIKKKLSVFKIIKKYIKKIELTCSFSFQF
jgi:hypothetical protein